MSYFSVVVGNIGEVYQGFSDSEAHAQYGAWVDLSEAGTGRAAGESVTLFMDGEIIAGIEGENEE